VFPGFHRPRSNFYRLPNAWFDAWRAGRVARDGGRIVGPLKATEYVVKWSWGYQNFDRPVRISWHHFQYGRVVDKARLDRGTGLSSRILGEALDTAVELGFLERHGDAQHPTYLPHLRPAVEDATGFLIDGQDIAAAGFTAPTANYFLVPAIWTDLTGDVSSEALILATEYLFRHTWGWDGGWERPCWLTTEEIAAGRRYRSAARAGERYDDGIGYSERALRDALTEGAKRGWLVWQETECGGRAYALHLKGMQVADDGRCLGLVGDGIDERAPLEPSARSSALSAIPCPEPSDAARLAQLEAQVRTLTQEVQALTAALVNVGIAPPAAPGTVGVEESKAVTEQSKAATAESKAVGGGKYSTSYTDTPDTFQTPAPDTRSAQPPAAGGGGDTLPDDLRQLLNELGFRGRRPLAELMAAYQAEPARVGGWIQHLSRQRAEYQQPAGFLLQSVVRERLALPPGVVGRASGNGAAPADPCLVCGGSGIVTLNLPSDDPDSGRAIPCPRCGGPRPADARTAAPQSKGCPDETTERRHP